MRVIRRTGRTLAADRSTKFLPIIVALIFFIGAVAIAIFRTAAAAGHNALSGTVFINVEAHSIAFSAQYFWIIPAVFLSSVIGVSQTEAAIPRILRRFQGDLDRLNLPTKVHMPSRCLKDPREDKRRIFHGGIYSWQPSKWQYKSHPPDFSHALLSYAILILSTGTGMVVSGFVPPDGFNCRHFGQLFIWTAWIISAQADLLLNYMWPLSSNKLNNLFWMTLVKDLLITVATMGGIVVSQLGFFNRCSCYTRLGRTGLALPERPNIAQTLLERLHSTYPAVTFSSIGIMLVMVPLYLDYRYRDALRVFVQRDDRRSNREWLWRARSGLQAARDRLQNVLTRFRWGRPKPQRAGITDSAAEQGDAPGSPELQTLTPKLAAQSENISVDNEETPTDGISQSTTGSTQSAQSESSSVEPPLPPDTNPLPRPETRRRDTEL